MNIPNNLNNLNNLNNIFIAGPCVIESMEILDEIAQKLVAIRSELHTDVIFKASFDKANRTSLSSYRGPGLERGLQMLADVKERYGLAVTTDIHEPYQAAAVGEVCDVLQIPAFLCRQTDLLVAASRTGRTVNIKKAQFLSAADMQYPVEKVRTIWRNELGINADAQCNNSPSPEVWLTERGTMFGPGNLVVDFRNLRAMQPLCDRVVMDCTHACQRPGGAGTTGGDRSFVPAMAHAAKAFGAQGYFFETHPTPETALSDGPNMLPLADLSLLVSELI